MLASLFDSGAAAIRIGEIPQTLDQVIVGTADRIRPTGIRSAYIIGRVRRGISGSLRQCGTLWGKRACPAHFGGTAALPDRPGTGRAGKILRLLRGDSAVRTAVDQLACRRSGWQQQYAVGDRHRGTDAHRSCPPHAGTARSFRGGEPVGCHGAAGGGFRVSGVPQRSAGGAGQRLLAGGTRRCRIQLPGGAFGSGTGRRLFGRGYDPLPPPGWRSSMAVPMPISAGTAWGSPPGAGRSSARWSWAM